MNRRDRPAATALSAVWMERLSIVTIILNKVNNVIVLDEKGDIRDTELF